MPEIIFETVSDVAVSFYQAECKNAVTLQGCHSLTIRHTFGLML